jgi:nitrogen fixation/metabolism regulation signal transduction histidine kinase
MDAAPVRRRGGGYLFIAIAAVVVLGSLFLLASTVGSSTQFVEWKVTIQLINAALVVVLALVLARRLYRLIRDYRNHVPGSRLTVRTVAVFSGLVIVPLLIIYGFALYFLNKGIDSWFELGIGPGINQGLQRTRAALQWRTDERAQLTGQQAAALARLPDTGVAAALDTKRREADAHDLIVFGAGGEILAASFAGKDPPLVSEIPGEVLQTVLRGQPYGIAETLADGDLLISVAVPIPETGRAPRRFLMARHLLPRDIAEIANAMQQAQHSYADSQESRLPLKYTFWLALTLVLLLAIFAAMFLAIRSAHRLMRPVRDLIEGTRAVGKGDFTMRLALPARDEMGWLVHSFNDMTRRLRRASEETSRSRAQVEEERERLAVILAGLSTGVLVLDTARRLRLANAAADGILRAQLAQGTGLELRELHELDEQASRLTVFAREVGTRLDTEGAEWRDEVALQPDCVLRCACAQLVDSSGVSAGHVLVFDDITHLLHAQREAAWGEVARRLAHEIKNPLMPIQLSAERLRRRLADRLEGEDAELLERATHTIVQQVESLKGMVNAFSEYARAPDLKLAPLDLNELVSEVVELHRTEEARATIELTMDPALPPVQADRNRLRQVLNNLITNGLEATDGAPAGRIEVTTSYEGGPEGGNAVIMVTDNGHGFDREMLARVFEPYVTSKPRGTGLGLAIVKKIAEEHGGSIEATNRPAGGAYVRVVLPVAAAARAVQSARDIA